MCVERDNTSEITRKFQAIANRCVKPLFAVSDGGAVLCPHHIGAVQELIVRELGRLHFLGLPDKS